jgi:outer membrane immunogenic protein
LYVKRGAALTDDKYSGLSSTKLTFDQGNEIRWGGTVGTGFEFSFAPDWSVAVEYDHLFRLPPQAFRLGHRFA